MAVIFGILSALSFGVGDFLARFSSKEIGFQRSLFWMLVVGSIFYLILYFVFYGEFSPNLKGVVLSLMAGILIMFGLLFLYKGLESGPVSIVAAIVATNPFFVFLVRFAFGTEPSVLQWIASIVIISGAVLISISASSFKDSLGLNSKQIKSTVIMSFVSSICLAFGLIFSQEASNHLSTTETVIYIRFFSLLSVLVILIFYRIKPILTKKSIPVLIFQGILTDHENSLFKILSVSFPKNYSSEMLLFNLDIMGISCSGGSACSAGHMSGSHVLDKVCKDQSRTGVRFSFSKYNTKEEIDFTIKRLKEIFN